MFLRIHGAGGEIKNRRKDVWYAQSLHNILMGDFELKRLGINPFSSTKDNISDLGER